MYRFILKIANKNKVIILDTLLDDDDVILEAYNQEILSGQDCHHIDGIQVQYLDKNQNAIEVGHSVDCPANETTSNSQEFNGTVDSFRNGNVVVEDGEGDCFEFEPNTLEITD